MEPVYLSDSECREVISRLKELAVESHRIILETHRLMSRVEAFALRPRVPMSDPAGPPLNSP